MTARQSVSQSNETAAYFSSSLLSVEKEEAVLKVLVANSSWMSPSAFFDENTTSNDGSRSMHSTRDTWRQVRENEWAIMGLKCFFVVLSDFATC